MTPLEAAAIVTASDLFREQIPRLPEYLRSEIRELHWIDHESFKIAQPVLDAEAGLQADAASMELRRLRYEREATTDPARLVAVDHDISVAEAKQRKSLALAKGLVSALEGDAFGNGEVTP